MRTRFLSSSDPAPHSRRPKTTAALSAEHIPVLLHETIEQLAIAPADIVVDATLGGAGHATALARILGPKGMFIGIDADPTAIKRAEGALKGTSAEKHLVQGNFRNLDSVLRTLGIATIDKALFDLGWSAYQLLSGRGFSFSAGGGQARDEPLLMTYAEPTEGVLTARVIVNEWSEESIADVLFGWGEERYSRRIAKRIAEYRKHQPIERTSQLAEIISSAVPKAYRFGRIHPATKTFQALRIAVNDELGALRDGLSAAWSALRAGGRIAVITFHSIEDRETKRIFADWEKAGSGEPDRPNGHSGRRVTKRPIRPAREEIERNPRSRSAKLRVIEKIV